MEETKAWCWCLADEDVLSVSAVEEATSENERQTQAHAGYARESTERDKRQDRPTNLAPKRWRAAGSEVLRVAAFRVGCTHSALLAFVVRHLLAKKARCDWMGGRWLQR